MASYTRVSDINERVNDLSLTMTQWRVLFAINSDTDLGTIKTYLKETSESDITDAINSLQSMGLLEGAGADAPAAAPEPEPVVEEAPAPEPEPVVEEAPAPEPEPVVEEEIVADIAVEEDSSDSAELENIVAEIGEDDDSTEIDFTDDISVEAEEEEAPAPEPESEPAAEAPAAPAADTGNNKTLVVADDSIVIRKMVELALENEAFNVVGYSSAQEVLDNMGTDDPALVIVDLNLPDSKGTEVVQKIKAKKDIPCLVFAAKNAGIDEDKIKSEGVADLVAKPFRDEDLIAKVKELA